MICPHCGAHLEQKAAVKFCGKCGKPLPEEQAQIPGAKERGETVRKCPSGHFFSVESDACPYCEPKVPKRASPAGETTGARAQQKTVLDRSEIEQAVYSAKRGLATPLKPTVPAAASISVPPPSARPAPPPATPAAASDDPLRSTGVSRPATAAVSGKLLGWLVSYEIDPNGIDIRLVDGQRYRIGAHRQCHVVVEHSSVSQHHATLVTQNGKAFIKDELSTNGTQVNSSLITEVTELSSYDDVKFGDVTFMFISSGRE